MPACECQSTVELTKQFFLQDNRIFIVCIGQMESCKDSGSISS